jgi:putative transposase
MTREARLTTENGCYHIITRGNQKQTVFLDSQDYNKYLHILEKYKSKYGFKLYCFCLMPNHVHLIIEVKDKLMPSVIMKCINLSYTIYFNSRHKKVGHLWQDRFKSKVIEKDSYLLGCIKYIEENPLRASLVKHQKEYNWSSYNLRGSAILDRLYAI